MNAFLVEISLALNRLFWGDNIEAERRFRSDAYKSVEAELSKKPANADNLTTWGAALLELNQFARPTESKLILKEAMSKLGKAVELEPEHDEAIWCLGHVHSALAFLTPDHDAAKIEFDKALEYFQKADQLCPGNAHYLKSLRANAVAPEWHKATHIPGYKPNFGKETHVQNEGSAAKHEPNLHKAMYGGLDQVGGGSAASIKGTKKKKSEISGTWSGWETFASGLVAGMIIMGQGTIKIKGPLHLQTPKLKSAVNC